MTSRAWLACILLGSIAMAQTTVERTIALTATDSPQGWQEIANTVRSIAYIQQAIVSPASKTLSLQTSATQADLAEWICNLLNGAPAPGVHQYVVPGGSDDLVRIFYPAHAGNPRNLQWLVNAVRSLTDIQRTTVFNPRRALTARGSGWQMGLAEWLLDQLDSPPSGQPMAAYTVIGADPVFKARGFEDPNAVRVFYLPPGTTDLALQNQVDRVRSETNVMRVVAYPPSRAIALRGTEEQAAAAGRILADGRN